MMRRVSCWEESSICRCVAGRASLEEAVEEILQVCWRPTACCVICGRSVAAGPAATFRAEGDVIRHSVCVWRDADPLTACPLCDVKDFSVHECEECNAQSQHAGLGPQVSLLGTVPFVTFSTESGLAGLSVHLKALVLAFTFSAHHGVHGFLQVVL